MNYLTEKYKRYIQKTYKVNIYFSEFVQMHLNMSHVSYKIKYPNDFIKELIFLSNTLLYF